MASFLRKIFLVAAIARFAMASAFAFSNGGMYRPSSGSTAYRSLPPRHAAVSARLDMSTAAPEAPVRKREEKSDVDVVSGEDNEKDRGWLVRLYNDPMNKREFVAMCLNDICGLGDGAAYDVMMKAHQTGIAVIGNYHRELAEMYWARLSGEGLLIDMVPADDD
jgi:ATP-dependent Clp protease adapter protein ClpS